MIYSLSLQTVGYAVGLLLVVLHFVALLHSQGVQSLLKGFPRSRALGIGLTIVAAIWAFVLVQKMDLGEFTPWRSGMLVVVVALAVAAILYVEEFLAVRALGILALLAAEPILEAAFLRPETSRLLLVVLAYVWIVLGLFWVGMPYLLRDQIAWVSKSAARWKLAAIGGLGYGAVLLVCTFLFYGKVG